MSHFVIKNCNNDFYSYARGSSWSAKQADAIRYVGKEDARMAIASADLDDGDDRSIPVEVYE